MSQKVAIMFMKNYFRKIRDIFWGQTMLLHFAEYANRYRENRDRFGTLHLTKRFLKIANRKYWR